MMILPEDLEGFPAPVVCHFCNVPVITRPMNERTTMQQYDFIHLVRLAIDPNRRRLDLIERGNTDDVEKPCVAVQHIKDML